jgi:hypothetical protein
MKRKELDVVEDAILKMYQTNKGNRRRVQIKVDQFAKITLVECFIGNVKSTEYGYRMKLFYHGEEVRETWGYNLTREERQPIIAKMLFEGFTQRRVSEMLRLHVSTIHKDVRYMREKTAMLVGYQARVGDVGGTKATSNRRRPNGGTQPGMSLH